MGGDAYRQDLPGDEIYTRIREAILRNRIGPGMKLAEVKLCELFGVNREVVRRALIRLASDGIVEYYPKRGAFVASPTPEQVAHVRDARIAIESHLVSELAGDIDDQSQDELERTLDRQVAHQRDGDKGAAVELSGAFHIVLAEKAGNPFCSKYILELSALTCLAIVKYAVNPDDGCPLEDHFEINTALREHDSRRAAAVMRDHLFRVHESILQRARMPEQTWDLAGIVADSSGSPMA